MPRKIDVPDAAEFSVQADRLWAWLVENAGAAFSFDWELVQPQVARFTRICTYDRAGYAWSDLAPEFDTFDQATHDLHLLLKKCRNSRPLRARRTLSWWDAGPVLPS